jgi:hypothetical protein
MQLQHLSVPDLIAAAGGDPWEVNESVQNGRPAQISDLAQAFHNAGRWNTAANEAFDAARRRFEAAWNRENGDHPINDSAEVQRATHSLSVQADELPKIGIDLETIAAALAEAQQTCAGLIGSLESELQQIDEQLGKVLDFEQRVPVTELARLVLNELKSGLRQGAIDDTRSALGELGSTRSHYSDFLQSSLITLRTKDGYDPTPIEGLDAAGQPSRAEPETNRQRNQIEAFARLFGRPPTSAADWETAAALDPHSYDPKNGGVPPNIVVGRIQPVPGQGVVRTNLFIPGRAALDPQLDWPPYHDNLGDDRGFSPTAGPEESRVAIYVDYENGIIVARQNPSIDEKTGQIRAGTPTISAVQQRNGSVLVKYSAADPFSPGGEGLAKQTPLNVNGTIAIKPTMDGPRVGGSVSNFPAIEVYSDRPGANTTTLTQAWPLFVDGPLGPAAGLWWHKPIGDAALELRFNDLTPNLGIPLPFLPHPGHPAPVTPIGPPLVATPPATYPLGPVDHPPQIGVHDPAVVLPPLLGK